MTNQFKHTLCYFGLILYFTIAVEILYAQTVEINDSSKVSVFFFDNNEKATLRKLGFDRVSYQYNHQEVNKNLMYALDANDVYLKSHKRQNILGFTSIGLLAIGGLFIYSIDNSSGIADGIVNGLFGGIFMAAGMVTGTMSLFSLSKTSKQAKIRQDHIKMANRLLP